MNDDRYERTLEELESHACKWWPREVREQAQKVSILQLLLDTQEKFISILKLTDKDNIESLFSILDASSFGYHLFLKHLVILTDFGSEPLQRINKDFRYLFKTRELDYVTNGELRHYRFSVLPVRGTLNNKRMRIDSLENLKSHIYDKELCKDLIMMLTYGAAALDPSIRAILYKCTLSEIIGNDAEIEDFVRKNYIRVSRIISGKTSTDLGNMAQQYVVDYLKGVLGDKYNVKSNGTIPNVTQNDGHTLTSFDIVVDRKDDTSRHKKYVAIEVTFQETTNSTIERKGGQAHDRFEKITSSRNYIAYILDGAGNFQRRSAVSVLCENSHCTVAYTPEEFNLLVDFIRERI